MCRGTKRQNRDVRGPMLASGATVLISGRSTGGGRVRDGRRRRKRRRLVERRRVLERRRLMKRRRRVENRRGLVVGLGAVEGIILRVGGRLGDGSVLTFYRLGRAGGSSRPDSSRPIDHVRLFLGSIVLASRPDSASPVDHVRLLRNGFVLPSRPDATRTVDHIAFFHGCVILSSHPRSPSSVNMFGVVDAAAVIVVAQSRHFLARRSVDGRRLFQRGRLGTFRQSRGASREHRGAL